AADARMRINVGIRRRLAPLMENNRRKIELVNSLLMTLIGSPILYYGDELGMGDNVFLGDRHGVRTPMQWTSDRNAGFSRADPQRLYLPPIMDALYGYAATNVEAQSRNPSSLLNWTKRVIAVRKSHPAFSRGTLRFIRPGNRKILAYVREFGTQVLLLVANLSRSAQPVELDLSEFKGRVPLELLGRTPFPPIGDLPYLLTLPGWGFYEFSLESDVAAPQWHEERPPRAELPLLVVPDGVRALLSDDTAAQARPGRALMARRVREQLERDVLPAFLREQRWFAGKNAGLARTTLIEEGEWGSADATSGRWLLAIARAELTDGDERRAAPSSSPAPPGGGRVAAGGEHITESQLYALPLAVAWEDSADGHEHERIASLQHCTVARVRQHARVGVLFDALWDDAFCIALVQAMGRNQTHALARSSLVFTTTRAYAQHVSDPLPAISHPALEQSNSMVIFGSQLVLKAYRRLRRGINPEIEIGRFLTDASPFANIAPVLGTLEYRGADDEPVALAVLQAFVPNQGSGWQVTLDYLARALEAARAQDDTARALGDAAAKPASTAIATAAVAPAAATSEHEPYLALARTLGKRTAEMHLALAHVTGDPAFDPEPASSEDIARWIERVRQDVVETLNALGQAASSFTSDDARAAQSLIARADALSARLNDVQHSGIVASKMRCHGDYHLGQVLVANHDFVIVDFEGEPSRPLAERRAKHSFLRDVAGMLRSFDYAAAVALREATRNEPADRARLAPYAQAWRAAASQAFLDSYFATVCDPAAPSRVLPADAASAKPLLDLFVIEKALYEVRYEIASRPNWVGVPLAGLATLLDQTAAENAA
ncbi:MAG: putative maltokinase, partial [Burkholderiaceae bacterium]